MVNKVDNHGEGGAYLKSFWAKVFRYRRQLAHT